MIHFLKQSYFTAGCIGLLLTALFCGQARADDPVLTKGQKVKILPLGDSLTAGNDHGLGGYRRPLYEWLIKNGYPIRYVGSQSPNFYWANPENPPNASDNSILWYEGYGGVRTDTVLYGGVSQGRTTVPTQSIYPLEVNLADNKPDVILLMIGTYDMLDNFELDKAPDRLQQILETIRTVSPKTAVIVASIPPIEAPASDAARVETASHVAPYNAAIPGIVDKQKALGQKVVLVDMNTPFGGGAIRGVHTDDNGYARMAGIWYKALTGEEPPPIDSANPLQIPPEGSVWNSSVKLRQEFESKDAPANAIWLDSLDLQKAVQSEGTAKGALSVGGKPLTIKKVVYPHGMGTQSFSRLVIDLHGAATRFDTAVGIDDEVGQDGSVVFSVWVDGKNVAQSVVLHYGEGPQFFSADLTGAQRLILLVEDGGDRGKNDHADWVGSFITLAPGASQKPETVAITEAPPRLEMVPENPAPAIHGARIVGTTPGRPFLFTIPATGTEPLTYSAENLPTGLSLDEKTGIITGTLLKPGSTQVAISVSNAKGKAQEELTIVGGDHQLALTPQMGWNSWNVWGDKDDEKKIRDAADELISLGLIRHGYQYINIDEGWEGKRDDQGNIQPNGHFSDMKKLTDDVHAKGLRMGIYSSPGPGDCGGFTGSYQHEEQDAQSYAKWGFDYLKYDYCSYDTVVKGDRSVETVKKPYAIMSAALAKTNRDIVYSLCEYGYADVWRWGASPEVRANSWRTFTDIDDSWNSANDWGANRGLYNIIEAEPGHEKYAGPGHWNDPDMLMVGIVGFGNSHPTRLTPNEQITHVSMWCMFSSPLLIGCDMTKMDPFTLAILTNDEALAINQDTLGKTASRVDKDQKYREVWSRPLADGTRAVALLNGNPDEQTLTVRWSDIGVSGKQPVRDLWLHKDVGSFDDSYSVVVPRHGTALLKIGAPSTGK